MKKLFILSCVLNGILFLSCHVASVPMLFAGEDEENMTTEQVEQVETTEQAEATEQPEATEQIDAEEPTQVAEQTDSDAARDDTADSAGDVSDDVDDVSDKEKSDEDLQPQTPPTNETANPSDAVKKPLVIDGLVLTEAERRVFELTNMERRKRGLPALRLDRRLMESARRQANWMARTGIFRHGKSGFAENIAMGQRSSRDVVVAWLNSAGHFRNMMNRSHGAIGIGSYRGPNGALFWCQQFSR